MRLKLGLPCTALALLCVTGCGSSKKSSSTVSKTPSTTVTTATATTTTTAATKSTAPPPTRAPSRAYSLTMSGNAETPPGAPKGSGHAVVSLSGKSASVCWKFSALKGFDKPTFAHIHQGRQGVSGNIVIPLSTGPVFKSNGCVPASAAILKALERDPKGFYVNIHSQKYPTGAIRSQL